jgi:creatinine amidohydrolase
MRIAEMNWMQVEEYLRRDDRCVLPIGSTEQHAYLSLATDSILAERVAVEAAEPVGVPVFPAVAYGITPNFRAYPGTVSLQVPTLLAIVGDALDSFAAQGFKRVLIVNGHAGNTPVTGYVQEWAADHQGVRVKFHSWWNAPRTIERVNRLDPVASHASWMENFPWTRLSGVVMPDVQKPMVDWAAIAQRDPRGVRELLGDGNFGGRYFRSDEELLAIWATAVEETRQLIAGGWE